MLCVHFSKGWKHDLWLYPAGVGLFSAACYWLQETALLNLLGMSLAQGLVLPLYALLYRLGRRGDFFPAWLCAPAAWITAEYIRSTFPLDGFPWLLLGYTASSLPPLLQTADLFGVWGPGLLMALASGVGLAWVAARVERRSPRGWRGWSTGLSVFLLLAVAALAYGVWRPGSLDLEEGPVLTAIQGNIPQKLKGDQMRHGDVMLRYLSITSRHLRRVGPVPSPDMVIWPETIYGLPVSEGEPGEIWDQKSRVGDRESRKRERTDLIEPVMKGAFWPKGTWFLVGATSYRLGAKGSLERRNSVFLYSPEGERHSSYSKTILVPGGEYLPWVENLPFREWIESSVRGMAGFLPDLKPGDGPRLHTLHTAEGRDYRFGIDICFENVYGDYCRRFVAMGAQFMVNISNEGWFGTSAEFDQMMAMSLFRAVETRRTLFRCTNTGISCVISPLGGRPGDRDKVVVGGRDRAVEGALSSVIPVCSTVTLYTRIGDLLALVVASLQIILVFGAILRSYVVTKRESLRYRG